ncbi:unnamed protein product [Cylindrotheca closterium]|uniref:ATP-dependent transporter ycf16 n=1 Tax=Cylindrotheca closterium TaxID=2856 RepID=A0AAD2CLW9_9STRA|nr:unnamed protein product [Cylindrotheca closterium]
MKGSNDYKKAEEWLWSEVMGQKLTLSVGAIAMMASSYANQAVPRLMGRLVDPKTDTKHQSNSLFSNILAVGLLGGLASFTRTVMLNSAKEFIAANLRRETFASLMIHRKLDWFQALQSCNGNSDETTTSEKSNEDKELQQNIDSMVNEKELTPAGVAVFLRDDVETASHTVTITLANMLRSTSSCVFGTYHMLSLNPELVCLAILVAPVVGSIGFLSRKYLKRVQSSQQEAALSAAAFVEDKLNHIMMVRLSNREQDEVVNYGQIQDENVQFGIKSALADGLSMGAMFCLSTSALCGVLFAGGKAVETKRMTHGDLLSFSTYSFMLALGSAGLARAVGEYMRGMRCARRLYSVAYPLVENEEVEMTARCQSIDPQLVKSISMEEVSFTFQSHDRLLLQDVSMVLQRGMVVAMTGQNGSGKSVLAMVLAGLYSPRNGRIVVEIVSPSEDEPVTTRYDFVNDIDRSHQASLVQVVPQQPVLFNTSIIENVRYSCPDAPSNKVSEALKAANCDTFVSMLDGGAEFNVGRNGSKLSGGQRQRLGLARALVADAPFLVLDEPASALDSEGATAVNDVVKACREQNRGLLIISHRINTLELADKVIVLKEGRIVQHGMLSDLKNEKEGELVALMPELVGR